MRILGSDTDGVTVISLKSLNRLTSKSLEKVEIESGDETITTFFFSDNSCYKASGFSIGYSGEGPKGLYDILNNFGASYKTFKESKIDTLDSEKNYIWTRKNGFEILEEKWVYS